MRVLIYEPKYVGHFLGFATWAANAFARRGHEVVFAVPRDAQETQQARVKLANRLPSVQLEYVIDVPVRFQKWDNARFESEALLCDMRRFEPDYVVAPSADFLLAGMLSNRRLRRAISRLSGADFVLHACPQAYPALGRREYVSRLVDRMSVHAARSVQLHTVDPYAVRSGALAFWGNPVRLLPHPFESLPERDVSTARRRLGLPQDQRIIGSLGDLGVRKGTDLLVHAFCQSDRSHTGLLLCGVLSDEVRQLVHECRRGPIADRIHVRDEFVSDDVFADAFYAVDGMWAGYPRQIGIASMLLYAADVRRPVLAADNGSIGWMTREYGLGRTFAMHDAARAIDWFADHPEFALDEAGAERLLAFHTLEHFEAELTRHICHIDRPTHGSATSTGPRREIHSE